MLHEHDGAARAESSAEGSPLSSRLSPIVVSAYKYLRRVCFKVASEVGPPLVAGMREYWDRAKQGIANLRNNPGVLSGGYSVLLMLLALLYAILWPGVLGEATVREETTEIRPPAGFLQERCDFHYTADRDETLGEFVERFHLATRSSPDLLCRQLGCSDQEKCLKGWRDCEIPKNKTLLINVGILTGVVNPCGDQSFNR